MPQFFVIIPAVEDGDDQVLGPMSQADVNRVMTMLSDAVESGLLTPMRVRVHTEEK